MSYSDLEQATAKRNQPPDSSSSIHVLVQDWWFWQKWYRIARQEAAAMTTRKTEQLVPLTHPDEYSSSTQY